MKRIILKTKKIGSNGLFELRNQLDDFVHQNFDLLYEGAVRMGKNIEEDYYAPRRIQINSTRLHESENLKYADGHKYSADYAPSEKQLRQTVKDLQELIDVAAINIPAPFKINIENLE